MHIIKGTRKVRASSRDVEQTAMITQRDITETLDEGSHYEPYCSERKFMEREGEPCRHCLRRFHDHYNGKCPKEEE